MAEATTEQEALDAYSVIVSTVAEKVLPSVASLRIGRGFGGAGSGVVITPDGFLVTSAHFVAPARPAGAPPHPGHRGRRPGRPARRAAGRQPRRCRHGPGPRGADELDDRGDPGRADAERPRAARLPRHRRRHATPAPARSRAPRPQGRR